MEIVEIVLGFIFGCISSGIVSLVWYKIFVPKIKFADSICRYESTDKNELSSGEDWCRYFVSVY